MRSLLLIVSLGLFTTGHLFAASVTIDAGESARSNVVVILSVPQAGGRSGVVLRSVSAEFPVQMTESGKGVVLLPTLKSGKTVFTVETKAIPGAAPAVSLKTNGPALEATVNGRPVFSYFASEAPFPRENIKPAYKRGGYIHPLRTWKGTVVTDDFPPNHVHHHGVWGAWTLTEFEGRKPDFWNVGEGKGTVVAKGLSKSWSGPVHGGFVASHDQVDLTSGSPKVALNETWTVTTYASASDAHPFVTTDLVITQRCASASALKLPKYHYGGLGFRGRWEWNGADKTYFLTSEGITNRIAGNESRARWCAISGPVEGGVAGVVIFDHPLNFRAPQPMRLHPTEPFFCYAPSQLGDFEIAPGQDYVSRYRLVTFDGPADAKRIEQLWNEYVSPLTANYKD